MAPPQFVPLLIHHHHLLSAVFVYFVLFVVQIPIPSHPADQAIRAASSVAANISEGQGPLRHELLSDADREEAAVH